ncbi:MAG: hypothetical protein ACI8R9_001470 [Paraglaciecola sp.]|jgi:hypothetical protein
MPRLSLKKKHTSDTINIYNINCACPMGFLLTGLIDRNSNKQCSNTLLIKRCAVHEPYTILPRDFSLSHRWCVF